MKTMCLLAGLLAVTSLCGAYDLKTRDGKVYHDIRLRMKDDRGIRIEHSGGTVFVDYADIPVPDLWTFGFEEEKYNAAKTRYATPPASAPAPASSSGRPAAVPRAYAPTALAPAAATATATAAVVATAATEPGVADSDRGQCAAYTKKGYRCSRLAEAGRNRCWQH